MDYEQGHYRAQLRDVIEQAEVMSIFFFRVGQSLILDFRVDENSDPFVTVQPMVESPYDRLLSFESLRAELPLPDELTLAPWSGRVKAFEREGILQLLLQRCDAVGGGQLRSSAEVSFRHLIDLEKQALRDMVRGVGMIPLWRSDTDTGARGGN